MDFEEVTVVNRAQDDIPHIIGFVRIFRDELVQFFDPSVRRVIGQHQRRALHVVLRHKGKEFFDVSNGISA